MSIYHHCRKIEYFSDDDKVNYSKFKHGSKSIARRYGKELAKSFVNSPAFDAIVSSGKTIVICPAPYDNISTASGVLMDYFMSELALYSMSVGITLEEAKIYRKHSYTTEYGDMSPEQRDNAISADNFHLDAEFLKGKHIVFVDDCRITGSHERRIQKTMELFEVDEDYTFVYYAALTDDTPAQIEGELNGFYVKGVEQILKVMLEDEFVYNTRVVKKILRLPHVEIAKFVSTLFSKGDDFGLSTLHTLVAYAAKNGYHKDETMEYNIKHLHSIISSYKVAVM